MSPRATRTFCWCVLFLVVALLAVYEAKATDLTVKCVAPLDSIDGTAIPSDETFTYNLYGGMQGSVPKLLTPTPIAPCVSVRTNVTPGTVCYAWSAFAIRPGMMISPESALTPQFCTQVLPTTPTPQPPGGNTAAPVTVATTVYMELQVQDGFTFLAVGTVPLGTPCDATQRVNNFNVVPASAVTWTGKIHRLAALAACSVTN